MATLPIALVQTRTPASPAAAFAHVEALIREAAAGGAKLILTPEATNFVIRDRAAREAVLATVDGDEAVASGLSWASGGISRSAAPRPSARRPRKTCDRPTSNRSRQPPS